MNARTTACFLCSIMIGLSSTRVTAQPPAPGSSLRGILRERGTRKPLADVTVYLKGTEWEATSDPRGRFEFRQLPPGRYTLTIPTTDYELFQTQLEIKAGHDLEASYYLEPKIYGDLEVVVRDRKEQKEVSRQVLTMREAKVIPGSQGDAVQVIKNMPGVLQYMSIFGIPIRGSNPEDSEVLLDGHRIPILFHFLGFKSVYNSDLLSEVNLYTGGFGPQFGNATGGVVELRSRAPRMDRWGGYLDFSFVDGSALVEGPITDKLGVAAAFRRSTIDLFLPLVMPKGGDVSFTTYPVYYDYQAKVHYQINKRHSLSLDVYGDSDAMALLDSGGEDTMLRGRFDLQMSFNSVSLRHRYQSDRVQSDLSPGISYVSNSVKLGPKNFMRQRFLNLSLREDLRIKLGRAHTLVLGANLRMEHATVEANLGRPPKEGQQLGYSPTDSKSTVAASVTGVDPLGAVYLADEIQLGPVLLLPSARLEYSQDLNRWAFNPRGLVRFRVANPLVLKAGAGLYHRLPDPDERGAPFGNPGLDFERAWHLTGGMEWSLTKVISLELQGYYKSLDRLVTSTDHPGGDASRVYDQSATGQAFGGEILLRHNWTHNLFGWISYSLSRSTRTDGSGTNVRLTDYDQTHNLVALGSWAFAKNWRLGLRFQYTSGVPYTNVTGSIFDGDTGGYLPQYDRNHKNQGRAPAYHQLDLRVDRQWVFKTWMLHAYLDVQNVYFHANPVEQDHNYDYSEQGWEKTLPIYPSIGLKGEF